MLDVFSRRILRGRISGNQGVTERTSIRSDGQETAPCKSLRPEIVSSQQLTHPCEVAKTIYFFFSLVSSMEKYVIFSFNSVMFGKTDFFSAVFPSALLLGILESES